LGDVSFRWESPFFRGQPAENPLSIEQNLAQVMTILKSAQVTKFMVIDSGVSSAQYGEVAAFCVFFLFS
jgi:hypothetical protein